MKRGELWTVAGGLYSSTPRPALIFQDDALDATASVTVLPLTRNRVEAPILRVPVPASESTGLDHDSDVMIDKLTTVRRSSVGDHVGRLSADQLADVERGVMVFLGLAR